MTHGGDPMAIPPPDVSGPRQPYMDLGYPSTKHTGNILRLLESSHGSYFLYNTVDSLSTVWHTNSQSWTFNKNINQWMAVNPIQALTEKEKDSGSYSPRVSTTMARLCSMSLSDDRTAMVKIVGQDGNIHYLQLLRLNGDAGAVASGGMARLANDGWALIQEVVVDITNDTRISNNETAAAASSSSSWRKLQSTLMTYLDIEHGGGDQSYEIARKLFHPDSKLKSVGIDDVHSASTQWTASVGSLVEIPLVAYLEGVKSQIPHPNSSKTQDAIVSIDCTAGGNAAFATVRVGNGSKTLVFEDHLLLGRSSEDEWFILSKTFSSQAWPSSSA